VVRAPSAIRERVFVGDGAATSRRSLRYENNAHSYRLTVAKLAQSKINISSFLIGSSYRDGIPFISLCLVALLTRRSGLGLARFGRIKYER
jgi:hypothetical protein